MLITIAAMKAVSIRVKVLIIGSLLTDKSHSDGRREFIAAMNSELTGSEPNLVVYFKFNEGVPSGNNTSVTTLINSALTGSLYNATLYNFTLNTSTSNFVIGKF